MTIGDTDFLDAVTSESAWLHGLARSLARDPERAADAAQRTLLTALERRPGHGASMRAWLATVLRRVLREEHRGEVRRADREALSPWPHRPPTPEETLARLEVQERVVAAIRALDEPYRSTLVQRFLDGRSVREIARRAGAPPKSVHTRVERGLALLRARLDRAHGGDRSAWLGALLVLRLDPAGPLTTGVGAMQAGTKALVAAAALAVVLGSAAWMLAGEGPRAELEPEGVAAAPGAEVAADPTAQAEAVMTSGRSAVTSAAVPQVPQTIDTPALELLGRVVDGTGAPIGGALVRYVDEQGVPKAFEPTTTDASGAFVLPLYERSAAYVDAELSGHATLARPYVRASLPSEELVIVLLPAEDVAGLVIDEAGVPLTGARVRIVFPDSAFHASTSGGCVYGRPPREARSDALSGFRIAAVPRVAGARISAELVGYLQSTLDLDGLERGALEIVLRRSDSEAAVVSGVVVDARGALVEGAYVSDGRVSVKTDAEGRFALELLAPRAEVELCAVLRGAMPARQSVVRTDDGFPPVTLQLGEAPLTISGRVLDEQGEPLDGAIVELLDRTPFGVVVEEHVGQSFETLQQVEELIRPAGMLDTTYTHLPGSTFAFHGLLPRSYRLIALDRHTLASAGPVEVQAGSRDVALRLVGLGPRRAVAGRVITRRGEPLAGVGIRLGRHIAGRKLADGGVPEVETDPEGRFALAPFHVRDAYLVLSGRQLTLQPEIELDERLDLEALELVAGVQCHVRVLCADPDFADECEFQDEQGEVLMIGFEAPGAGFFGNRMTLSGGNSGTLLTDDRAAHLVLYRAGAEVHREGVELEPGAETELRVP